MLATVPKERSTPVIIQCTYDLHICLYALQMVLALDVSEENDGIEESSRTELDSHANMSVVGRNACIISDTGRVANVNPFTPDYNSMMIPIICTSFERGGQGNRQYP
jgi:hypothetical protein